MEGQGLGLWSQVGQHQSVSNTLETICSGTAEHGTSGSPPKFRAVEGAVADTTAFRTFPVWVGVGLLNVLPVSHKEAVTTKLTLEASVTTLRAGGTYAKGLLTTLMAGLSYFLVIDAVALAVVAIHKQLPLLLMRAKCIDVFHGVNLLVDVFLDEAPVPGATDLPISQS
jgi:hypothetical protein